MRTDHNKMVKDMKYGKSGSKAKLRTPLQTFKLNAYRFLDAHYKPRTKTETLGEVSICSGPLILSISYYLYIFLSIHLCFLTMFIFSALQNLSNSDFSLFMLQIAGQGSDTLGADSSGDEDVGEEARPSSSQRERGASDEKFRGRYPIRHLSHPHLLRLVHRQGCQRGART